MECPHYHNMYHMPAQVTTQSLGKHIVRTSGARYPQGQAGLMKFEVRWGNMPALCKLSAAYARQAWQLVPQQSMIDWPGMWVVSGALGMIPGT